jgi:GT2 family glycosyltransferase
MALARSLIEQTGTSWGLTLVNNDDDCDGTRLISGLEAADERIRVVHPSSNLGYFGGARYALNMHLEQTKHLPDWIIVSNCDIRLHCRFFETILGLGEYHDVVAPSIVSELTGHDQNPYLIRPLSTRAIKRNYLINSHFVTSQAGRFYSIGIKPTIRRIRRLTTYSPCQIYAPHGSLICFRRSWFERGGSLDHGVFLYGEEITIGERARNIGARVSYVPAAEAFHNEHKSTGILLSRRVVSYQAEAARYVKSMLRSGNLE